MGDPNIKFGTGHISPPIIMRTSRGKLFAYFAVLVALCCVVLLLSSAHSTLRKLEASHEKCLQQRDSFSAQLQVLYEHRNRLEQSLQKEQASHKITRDELEKQLQEKESKVQQEKEKEHGLETQLSQLKANFEQLGVDKSRIEATIEQLRSLQGQKDEEVKKLEGKLNDLLAEKGAVEHERDDLALKLHQQSNEATLSQAQLEQVNEKLAKCNEDLQGKSDVVTKEPSKNVDATTANKMVLNAQATTPPTKERSNPLARPIQKGDEKTDSKPAIKSQINDVKPDAVEEVSPKNNSLEEMKQLPPPFSAAPKNEKEKVAGQLNAQESDNLPQVAPPEQIQNYVEKGEEPVAGEPLERPSFKVNKKNDVPPNNQNYGLVADQMRDMMDKSPGEANDANPQNVPPLQNRLNAFNRESNVIKPRVELPVPDRNYGEEDEDDPDGENDEEAVGGIPGPNMKGFAAQDFEDHEPLDNNIINNNIFEEGVVASPR